ncbi:hypothetical protein AVEN_142216-1, partial [Araneus ventricosus]
MMKREEEDRLEVGEIVLHPDKSWKLNFQHASEAGSNVLLAGIRTEEEWIREIRRDSIQVKF